MKKFFELNFIKIISFIKKTIGLTDKLTLLRHVIISIYSWILSPILFQYFNELTSGIIMFLFMLILTGIFLKISSKDTEKSFLLDIVSKIYRKKRPLIYVTLFLIEPFLFIIEYKNSYHKNSINKHKDVIFYLLLIISSLSASGLWAIFIHFFGKDIFDFMNFIYLFLSNIFI